MSVRRLCDGVQHTIRCARTAVWPKEGANWTHIDPRGGVHATPLRLMNREQMFDPEAESRRGVGVY